MIRYQRYQRLCVGFFSILALSILSGCNSAGGDCSELYGCSEGSICFNGTCEKICNGDSDCEDGDRCRSGICVNPEAATETCGNGLLDAGEECDDANVDNTDSCLNTCVDATCGDGFIKQSEEECDLGSGLNKDDGVCTATCQQAVCGDGLVQADVEVCDNGSDNSDDWAVATHCNSTCDGNGPYCGDGATTARRSQHPVLLLAVTRRSELPHNNGGTFYFLKTSKKCLFLLTFKLHPCSVI